MGCMTFRYTSAIMAPIVRRYALNSSSGHVSITRRMDSFRIAEHCLIAASTSRAVSLLESMVGGSELNNRRHIECNVRRRVMRENLSKLLCIEGWDGICE